MDKSSIYWSASRRAVCLIGAVLLAAGAMACGDDNGSKKDTNSEPDAADVSTDVDAGSGDDAGADVGGDGGDSDADAQVDTGPPDDDADGVANADDNCPDAANADQADLDRDGVGDVCDHFASIHDPSNPDSFETTAEDEANISNDAPREGEAYELSLPFLVEGNVGAVDNGNSDLDYYSFSVSEPTLLLVQIESRGDTYWPGGVLFGYEARNGNVNRFALGEDTGGTHYREMFLPVPGRYSLVVTDARNMLNSPDVGGDGYDYTVTASAVPMPEPETLDLPAAPVEKDVDRKIHIYEVDAQGLDALTVASTGVPRGDNSITLPMLAVYDPDENRTLSLTSPYQTNQNNAKIEYTTNLGDRDRVWVIEDYWQRFGLNDTILEVNEATVDAEFETFSEPQDERSSELVWMQPGVSVEGTIGPPRTVSSTSLAPDVDYFLATVQPGSLVTFTVEPTDGGALQPDVDLGFLYEQQGSSTFYWMEGGPNLDNPGETATVTAFYDGFQAGEAAIRIRHEPNNNAESPEGGPGFEYTVSMDVTQPTADDLGPLPAVVTGTFDTPGETDFYTFSASAGDRINFRLEENNYFGQLTVYDADTFQPLIQTYSSRDTMIVEEDGDYIVHVAPYNEERDPTYTYELGVEKISATDLGTTPASQSGVVDNAPFPAWFKMTVTPGTAYEATLADVADGTLEGRIRVYAGETMDQLRGGAGPVRWMAPDGVSEVYIEVADAQNRGDAGYTFTLAVDELDSADLTLDTLTTGQLADGASQMIYTFSAPEGAVGASVTTDGSWEPTVALADAADLRTIGGVDAHAGQLFYAESKARDYALFVGASDDTLTGPLDFEVEVTVHEPSAATAETEPNDTLADVQTPLTTPAIISGAFDDASGDTTDVFTLDLVTGQRVWVMSINRNSTDLYNLDPELEIYDPSGTLAETDRDAGEAFFPAIYAFEATADGIWEIRHQLEYGGDTGDYTLYVFTSTP
ncbi:hypothetical protein FIV42_21945 [Persicimonas caeni]|uniref:Peptidase C-terminal archaeal/bacterial domain-containing protein n=1 Tax=Persicimonas caeni TaxID=2292766 RepID=A0A4Y6PYA2_PERCE|nr:hypothetical protein FIV42_21945 [Persicimonas caeni]QED34530.1 hypothetical protein FRD00_21940 [Persicimonas caeni]